MTQKQETTHMADAISHYERYLCKKGHLLKNWDQPCKLSFLFGSLPLQAFPSLNIENNIHVSLKKQTDSPIATNKADRDDLQRIKICTKFELMKFNKKMNTNEAYLYTNEDSWFIFHLATWYKKVHF